MGHRFEDIPQFNASLNFIPSSLVVQQANRFNGCTWQKLCVNGTALEALN